MGKGQDAIQDNSLLARSFDLALPGVALPLLATCHSSHVWVCRSTARLVCLPQSSEQSRQWVTGIDP